MKLKKEDNVIVVAGNFKEKPVKSLKYIQRSTELL